MTYTDTPPAAKVLSPNREDASSAPSFPAPEAAEVILERQLALLALTRDDAPDVVPEPSVQRSSQKPASLSPAGTPEDSASQEPLMSRFSGFLPSGSDDESAELHYVAPKASRQNKHFSFE